MWTALSVLTFASSIRKVFPRLLVVGALYNRPVSKTSQLADEVVRVRGDDGEMWFGGDAVERTLGRALEERKQELGEQ